MDVPRKSAFDDDLVARPNTSGLQLQDPNNPHLLDQAILRRTEGPLDSSLRLGRACQDHLDPQLAQRSGDDHVGPLLLTSLGHRPKWTAWSV